jgi:hypothetical protein
MTNSTHPDGNSHHAILLKELRAGFKRFGAALSEFRKEVRDRMDRTDTRMSRIERKLTALNTEVTAIRTDFAGVDRRVSTLERGEA